MASYKNVCFPIHSVLVFAELLHTLFNMVNDVGLVDEQEFYMWKDDGQIMYGKGTAVASVYAFFEWLKSK